jgi:hypothetical protein
MTDPRLRALVDAAAGLFLCTPEEILSKDRHQHIAAARHAVMWVIRERWGFSFPATGRMVGRDHTSVMSGASRIRKEIRRGTHFGRLAIELHGTNAAAPPRCPGIRSMPGLGVELDESDFYYALERGA